MKTDSRTAPIASLLAATSFALLTWGAAEVHAQNAYGYFRTVEGYASLLQGGSETQTEVEPNYPIVVGDLVQVSRSGRVEAVLPDGSYLRLGSESELGFDRVALSADTEDDATVLRLLYGELQLVLPADSLADEAVRIDTVNATIYVDRRGAYRIASDGTGWTEVLVREGFAEVVTPQGSAIVRAAESATVRGEQWPAVTLASAGPKDSLERWGDQLQAQAALASSEYIDPHLGYSAAPLYEHGSWVEVGGQVGWRPRVAAGWRPYHAGWWTWTPTGVTWVPFEPWGWVTSHYGYWDLVGGYGWVWYPGSVYTPAAVYWYWGPSYVGWVPAGYYLSYYGPRWGGFQFSFGVYGWAGGHYSYWNDWTFCRTAHFGYRHSRRHYASGGDLHRRGVLDEMPRGIVATDTRGLSRDILRHPERVMDALSAAKTRSLRVAGRGDELPDVTPFVARRADLAESVARAVMPRASEAGVTGTMSRPSGNLPSRAADRIEASGRADDARSRSLSAPGSSASRPQVVEAPRDWRTGTRVRRVLEPAPRPEVRTRSEIPADVTRGGSATSPGRLRLRVVPPARPEGRDPAASWRERRVPATGFSRIPPRTGLEAPPSSLRGGDRPVVQRVLEGVKSYRRPEGFGASGPQSILGRPPSASGSRLRPSTPARPPSRPSSPPSVSGRSPSGRSPGGTISRQPSGSAGNPERSSSAASTRGRGRGGRERPD